MESDFRERPQPPAWAKYFFAGWEEVTDAPILMEI
jgi:hypothetical protein